MTHISIPVQQKELLGERGRKHSRYSLLRACLAFFIGGISSAIRFTSVAAILPLGMILAMRRRTLPSMVGYLFLPCAVFGILGVGVTLLVDRLFYGFWATPILGSFHFNVILGASNELL